MCLRLSPGKEGSAAEWFEQTVGAEQRISSIADVPEKSCLSSVMSTMISSSRKLSQFQCSILWSDPSTPSYIQFHPLWSITVYTQHKNWLHTSGYCQCCQEPSNSLLFLLPWRLAEEGMAAFLPAVRVSFTCDCCSPFFVALVCTKIPTLTDCWNQKGRKREMFL